MRPHLPARPSAARPCPASLELEASGKPVILILSLYKVLYFVHHGLFINIDFIKCGMKILILIILNFFAPP